MTFGAERLKKLHVVPAHEQKPVPLFLPLIPKMVYLGRTRAADFAVRCTSDLQSSHSVFSLPCCACIPRITRALDARRPRRGIQVFRTVGACRGDTGTTGFFAEFHNKSLGCAPFSLCGSGPQIWISFPSGPLCSTVPSSLMNVNFTSLTAGASSMPGASANRIA